MDIKPTDATIRQLFNDAFYVIPRFQRPYSWDSENLEDFWRDINDSHHDNYFMGSIVLVRKNKDTVSVVDGQQRLTTVSLLLCVIRDKFDALSEKSLANGAHNFIERKDEDYENRFVIFSETPYPFFQEHVQQYPKQDSKKPAKPEELQIQNAYSIFNNRVNDKLRSIELDTAVTKEKRHELKIDFLKLIRNKLLDLMFISITLDDEDFAYIIFETLNTRGKDLRTTDLVKNHILKFIPKKNQQLDKARDSWKRFIDLLEGSAVDINPDTFFLHQWLSTREYTAQKKLFKSLKQTIRKTDAQSYLSEISDDAELYRTIREPSYKKWPKNQLEIKRSLEAFEIFRLGQARPLVLSLLRAYDNKKLSLGQLRIAFTKIENFNFHFTAVTSQRAGGGIAGMYARVAREVHFASTKDEIQQILSDFYTLIRDKNPPNEEFGVNFENILFYNGFTKDRQFVRYILRKVDRHYRPDGSSPDYEDFTIEHIYPQNSGAGKYIAPDYYGQLGNLIFIPDKMNGKLSNIDPKDKLKFIRGSADLYVDNYLKSAKDWKVEDIIARTKHLSEIAAYKIWSVS